MPSLLHEWASLSLLVLLHPQLLLAKEKIGIPLNEICVAHVPAEKGPSLLQDIVPWRSAQPNLSTSSTEKDAPQSTHGHERTRFAALGTEMSELLPQKQFRLTKALLLAVRHNTWSSQSKYLVVGFLSVTFCLGAGFIAYCYVLASLWNERPDAADNEKETTGGKKSSFTSGIVEGFFAKNLASCTHVAKATECRGLLTQESQSTINPRHPVAMEKDLVNIVANAHYDVTRYPGHVVCITSHSSGERHGFLEGQIHSKVHSKVKWSLKYLLAMGVTCLMPLIAVFGKAPTECAVIKIVSKIALPSQEALKALIEEENLLCNIHRDNIEPLFVVAAGCVGYLICFVFTISLHVSILTGAHKNWVFNSFTRCLLWTFNQFSAFMRPVVFNYVNKPENSNLSSISCVWKWLSYTPYMIIYLWTSTMLLFVCGAIAMHEVEWGGILILCVGSIYLPVMSLILGANDRLCQVITSALENTYFPCGDDENTPTPLRAMSLNSSSVTTDVWYRLFQNRGRRFACSTHEFDLLLRYLEDSHNGTKQGGKRWPIWWHDDVAVTGNNVLTEVFLQDMGVTITNVDRTPYSHEYGNLDAGAEEILTDFHKRLQALCWSAPEDK